VDVSNVGSLPNDQFVPLSMYSGSYEVHIGNRDWLKLNNVHIPDDIDEKMILEEENGNIITLCAINGMNLYFFLPYWLILF
jgi:hypothetical protein